MKKIIIILVVLLLLGGGGGAAYFFLFMQDEEEMVEVAPLPEALDTVPLSALSIPVIRQGRVAKYVMIKVELELMAGVSGEKILLAEPRLRDSCLRELHDYFASIPVEAPINIRTVKKRLMRAVRDVLGNESITEVLIQGVYEKKN